ncbi:MAG: HYR domain-containing protein, partial [Chitinophagales bacterium]|nr:HYR domain-containing protein [Chitinophagales bacterium]
MNNKVILSTIILVIFKFTLISQSRITAYTYDDLNRLTYVTNSNGIQIEYGFDELGNRIFKRLDTECPISTAITITNITETTATVSWMNSGYPTTVSNFNVEISQNNSTWNTVASGLTVLNYNLTGLVAGQSYYVRIISNCTNGMSEASPGMPFSTIISGVSNMIGECPDGDDDEDKDKESPVFINCPTSRYVFGNDPDLCGAYVNFSIPVALDNCPGVTITHSGGVRPGDFLPIGIHTATYTATDASGNSSTCTITIEVKDTQRPLLACPDFKILENDFGVCSRQVFGIAPRIAYDNCDYEVTWSALGATPSAGMDDASGTIFPVGTTTVTYTIRELNNPDGNQEASCSFDITIRDTELPTRNYCPGDIVVSAAPDACGQIVYYDTPTFNDNCDGTGLIGILTEGLLSGSFFSVGTTKVVWSYTDAAGNGPILCEFNVTVIDDVLPEIFCEELTACTSYTMNEPLDIKPNDVSTFTFNVPADVDITDVNIKNMSGSHPAMEHLTMTLTSPNGTVVTLFNQECTGSASFVNIGMDDTGSGGYVSGSCNLVNNFTYIPASPLAMFNGERSIGTWTLSIISTYHELCGSLDSWTLEICGNDVTSTGNRLQVLADPGTCNYTMLTKGFDPRYTDNCPDPYIRHDYIFGPFDHTLQGSEFALGESLIQWTVFDQSGNTSTCNIIVEVIDNQAPEFLNCPRQDIVQNAETGTCGAYVTFQDPIAVDNCNQIVVTQVDQTGLTSGSVFPVGMTILEWQAEDPSGNIARCSLRVIVNDTQLPNFECRDDVLESTDPWKCSAVVQNIGPVLISDNCIDNVAVTYQIEYPAGSGIIVQGGATNASGERFLDGTSRVYYHMQTQPLLLITEVTHAIGITNGGMDPVPYVVKTTDDYVEITNIGPATMNISGLTLERLGYVLPEVWTVPDNTIMGVGQTLVVHFGNGNDDPINLFFNVPCAIDMTTGQGAAYVLSFKGRVLDVVSVNGYAPVGQGTAAVVQASDWTGSIPSMQAKGGVFRKFSYDNNQAFDWEVAEVCRPITIGQVNPTIDIMPDNGSISAFQSIEPHTKDCAFNVTIIDQELPYCGEFIENIYNGATNLSIPNSIIGGKIYQSIIHVPDNFIVGDVDLLNITGQHPEMSDLKFRITSPEGTTVLLINGMCVGTSNFNLSLDSDSLTSVLNAPCGPLGAGGTFSPLESLNAVNYGFYGENAQGNWLFEICDSTAANSGMLTNWTLRLWEINNYSQGDTIFINEPGLCGADFTWVHPRLIDNCKEGTVELKYLSSDPIPLPASPGFIVQADTITEFFAVGTTIVRYILTDGSGNIDSCEFRVTILDVDKPKVYCPNDIIVQLKGGECRTFVCYGPVIATDNCAVVDTAYSIIPCLTYFEIGTTPVTIYVYDKAGNVDSCTFNVIVREYVPKTNILVCNDHLNLSLGQDCEAEILPDMLLEGDEYRCYEDYLVELFDFSGNLIPSSPFVYIEHEGQTLIYKVTDPITGNSCSGTILIEAKAIPLIDCPADTVIYCSTDKDLKDALGYLLFGEVELKSCKPDIIITHEDVTVRNQNCSDPIAHIYRTFRVSDKVGNQATCTQEIEVKAFDFDQIVWPKDAVLSCDTVDRYPGLIQPNVLGYPTIDGVIVDKVNALCNLSHTYEDQYLWICGGSYEIIRKWVIRNRCEPISATNPIIHYQLIEVLDTKAPLLHPCPDEVVFSVDPWSCSGAGFLPIPENIGDKCSAATFNAYIYGGGFIEVEGSLENNDLSVYVYHVKKGTQTLVKYVVTDECGNESTCIFPVKVLDQTAPIAIAKQNVVMSLTGGATSGDGIAKLYAWQVDNGSFDQCTRVKLEIRRIGDQKSACQNIGADGKYNNNLTFNNHNGVTGSGNTWLHPDDNANDTDGGEYVKFCCDDIPAGEDHGNHQVELRVWDDGNMNGIIGDNLIVNGLKDNHNTTWAYVQIDNKIPPQIVCPPDVTVTCDM